MKKLFSALLVLVLCSSAAFAATDSMTTTSASGSSSSSMMNGIKWVAMGGVNYSTLSGPSVAGNFGFNVGGAGVMMLDKSSAVGVGLLYSMENSKMTSGTEQNIQMNFVQVPVMYHYMINESWSVGAGAYLGYLFSANNTTAAADVKSLFNSLDYGLSVGAGYMYQNWMFGLGYQIGLANLANSNGADSRLSNVTVKAAYLFM